MEWVAIATLVIKIIQAVAPAVEECLNDRLERASHHMPPPETFGTEGAAATALIDKAIEMTPKRRFFVRHALEEMKDSVVEGDKIRTTPPTEMEAKRARRLVGAILMQANDD